MPALRRFGSAVGSDLRENAAIIPISTVRIISLKSMTDLFSSARANALNMRTQEVFQNTKQRCGKESVT